MRADLQPREADAELSLQEDEGIYTGASDLLEKLVERWLVGWTGGGVGGVGGGDFVTASLLLYWSPEKKENSSIQGIQSYSQRTSFLAAKSHKATRGRN